MSSFDVKHLSESDAFKLETAIRDEVGSHEQADPESLPTMMTGTEHENSPVAAVIKEVVSHWIDEDEAAVERFAEASGDEHLEKKISGLSELNAQPQGMTGDFKADSAGPEEAIDTPPKMDGGEFGGGGGGGGDGAGAEAADWMDPDGRAAEIAAEAVAEADERGFDPGGGDDDDEGEGDEEATDDPPPGKNKPKK
jgi:hypothetical protein